MALMFLKTKLYTSFFLTKYSSWHLVYKYIYFYLFLTDWVNTIFCYKFLFKRDLLFGYCIALEKGDTLLGVIAIFFLLYSSLLKITFSEILTTTKTEKTTYIHENTWIQSAFSISLLHLLNQVGEITELFNWEHFSIFFKVAFMWVLFRVRCVAYQLLSTCCYLWLRSRHCSKEIVL